ncbi:hypothetical protein PspMM1_02700 [Pseudoalteromonas sp. MM1]|jgi:hypothetical protein|nr:hypothetical protein PspMM1_02700 [Pseudoalteromonas sp. MM1]
MGFSNHLTDTIEKKIIKRHNNSSGTENKNSHEKDASEVMALNEP